MNGYKNPAGFRCETPAGFFVTIQPGIILEKSLKDTKKYRKRSLQSQ